ncbi:uncharacterized UDP-glucosyltransferase YjiC-like [Tetranychus urticae]|uniref:UDP-glycosyltransferase 201G1 n=1 Tax=Tetranychus urticae TaxID=32264 RepID=T1KCF7_TETUR|nr:uncharacterized UDP-glucosyltransferase YjiC-like [Tetranychus urticae]AHX56871.1 UDP-glycosyltransferase 201G1 [Tetranychus urticae]
MPKKKYSFLLTAMNAAGPVNAVLGFGELLKRHGHEVTFAHRSTFRRAAESRGFLFLPLSQGLLGDDQTMLNAMDTNADTFRIDPLERYRNVTQQDKERLAALEAQYRNLEQCLFGIVAAHQTQFDAFVHDFCDLTRALFATRHPVISLLSANPLCLYENGPPISFGFSTTSDPNVWAEAKRLFIEAHELNIARTNTMLSEFNRPAVFDPLRLVLPVKTIGFYHYPAQLDYEEYSPKEGGWHRIDCFIRSVEPEGISLPLTFFDKPGKLIYFSLGSIASSHLDLMQQIIDILAKAPHKFIISKGIRGDDLKLYDNMWGQNHLDQIQVLDLVDLVIIHGGNNSLMETLYYAKPFIVIPYFFDQYDNAQRVVDRNVGYRINIWEINEERLLNCIELALNDVEKHNRIREISQSMRNSDSGTQAVRMIETIIEEAKASRSSSRSGSIPSSRPGSRPGSSMT